MIADSVGFLVAQGKRVIYDAEHFFDGFRDDPDYALRCLRAAAEAGAENVTLCDTNGSSRARAGERGHRAVVAELGDSRARSASTRTTTPAAAWPTRSWPSRRGARLVQGTMNGYGERCGNANLVTIVPTLELKMGYDCIGARPAARA